MTSEAGLFYASTYEVKLIQLAPGETLLFYTDGATEARDRSDSEYGHERFARLATGQSHLPPKELVKACRNDVSGFTSSAHLSDDLTLLRCAARSVAIGRNKGPVLLRFSRSGHRKQGTCRPQQAQPQGFSGSFAAP